jgi:HemY protein
MIAMLRVLSFVIAVALLVAGAVWLADHPGAVMVEWLGWRIETSVPVVLMTLLVAAVAVVAILRMLADLWRLPSRWAARRSDSRRRLGYQALSDGLAAAAVGEGGKAHKLALRANKLLADPTLTTMLSAQAAHLAGDLQSAERDFIAMLDRPETAALGLRGLLDLAMRRGDDAAAVDLAQRARKLTPAEPGLAETLFKLLVKTEQSDAALTLVADAGKRKIWPPADTAHRRAVVLNEQAARAAADGDQRTALALAGKAVAADPGLTAAALRMARLLILSDHQRRAAKVLEQAWKRQPVPDLARAYADLQPGEDPVQWVRRLEALTAGNPDHPESHLALAEALLTARLWGQARRHLMAVVERHPTGRAYRLLSRLEQEEYDNQTAARDWLQQATQAPADSQWSCAACGTPADTWSTVCRHCGAVDTIAWTPSQTRSEPVAAIR